ncbi:hypothetical protein TNCV_3158961 [Trichonephila clavipes]|nr:hypothetical protein TNCV_3158961 [Trichonephila clavipes]
MGLIPGATQDPPCIWADARRRAASPLGRLVERNERRKAPAHLPQNWSGTKRIRTVICMVHKAKANVRHTSSSLLR